MRFEFSLFEEVFMSARLSLMRLSAARVAAVAALGFVLALTGSARANEIDEGLRKQSSKINKAIKEGKYANVGVLRFKVQQGAKEATFHFGDLNKLMATRLGNMLILGNSLKTPIGVIPDAADQAAKADKTASWRTDADRKKLFTHDYVRPWREDVKPDRVKVDAFLTGEVQVSKDFQTTRVVVYLFDKKDSSLREVASFEKPMERSTLTDMDISFKVEKKNLKKGSGAAGLDLAAAQNASEVMNQGGNGGGTQPPTTPPYTDWLDFQIFYDDMQQQIATGDNASLFKLPTPNPNQKIYFKVTNKKQERIAIVILVNGVNTLGDEMGREKEQFSRWVLEGGKTYAIYGFYPKETVVKPFIAKAPSDVSASDFVDAEKYKIQIHVFAKGDATASDTPKAAMNFRSNTNNTVQANSLNDMQVGLLSNNKGEKRNLIVGGGPETANLELTTFEGTHQATGVLVYGGQQ